MNDQLDTRDNALSGTWRRIEGKGWLRRSLGAALVACTLVALAVASPTFRHELYLSFMRQPIGFTELYFVASRNQVIQTSDGRQQVAVDFVINNRGEAHDLAYTYRVWAAGSGREILAERTQQIVIPIDAHREVSVLLDLPAGGQLAAVEVGLLGRPERIRDAVPIGDAR